MHTKLGDNDPQLEGYIIVVFKLGTVVGRLEEQLKSRASRHELLC